MRSLTDKSAGRWFVTTASGSRYLLDLDAHTSQRVPSVASSDLRRDEQPVPLLRIITCEVGVLLELVIDVRGDGVVTYRRGTAVEEIEAAA